MPHIRGLQGRGRRLRHQIATAQGEALCELSASDRDEAIADRPALRLVGGLDHHPQERLGPGRTDEHPAVPLELSVLLLDRTPQRVRALNRIPIRDANVLEPLWET